MPKKPPLESPLYVKLPADAVEKLSRAAEALGVHKKDLVANLVTKYVDPDSERGLDALNTLSQPRRLAVTGDDASSPRVGWHSFRAYDPPEILNVEQAAEFLQVEQSVVVELAEAGRLPGRKLGNAWRFSREALVAWLAEPETRR